jgi:hypothetical protein
MTLLQSFFAWWRSLLRSKSDSSASSGERQPSTRASHYGTGVFPRFKGEPEASAADREELVSLLSRHVGPLARVLVERIDSRGLTRNDLFMAAAQALDDDSVRERFMQEVGLYR